ncbi:MAG: hypothetical protein OXN81_06570 [Alphaproteobacteria bacterium]|nr:hypothetical protein [Alphaproteobacteria bacterium]
MPETRVFPLSDGLPASLKGGPEGFNALCALLGIVGRHDKRQLRHHSRVSEVLKAEGPRHAPGTKTAVRIRKDLSYFFCLAFARRDIWIDLYDLSDGFSRPMSDPFPCLEYVALRNYGVDLSAGVPTDAVLSGFGDYIRVERDFADYEGPALSALPALCADLENWVSLDKDRRRRVKLAAFAVSSLLDDARLLRRAGELDSELAAEFAFAIDGEGMDLPAYDPEADILYLVTVACNQIIRAAQDLIRDPFDPALFDDVERFAANLETLRIPAMEYRKIAITAEALSDLFAFFTERAEGDGALLDRLPEIENAWKTTEQSSVDEFRETIAAARRNAEGLFDEWDKARSGAERMARLLSACEARLASEAEDAAGEQELKVAKYRYEHLLAVREKRDAEDGIVAAMSSAAAPKKWRLARWNRKRNAGSALSANPGQAAASGVLGAVKGMFGKRG